MITFTVDSAAIQRKLQGASTALKRNIGKSLRTRTKPGVMNKFQLIAPKLSGDFRNSAVADVDESNMTLTFKAGEGLVGKNTGFPYPKWLAGEIPSIHTRSPMNKYFAPDQTIGYGSEAVSPKGKSINWSASPRWWRGLQTYARRKAPQDVNHGVKQFTKQMNR